MTTDDGDAPTRRPGAGHKHARPPAETPDAGRGRLLRALVPRGTRGQLLAGLLCAVLGFALVVQVRQTQDADLGSLRESDLVRILDDVGERDDRLESEQADLQRTREQLQTDGSAPAGRAGGRPRPARRARHPGRHGRRAGAGRPDHHHRPGRRDRRRDAAGRAPGAARRRRRGDAGRRRPGGGEHGVRRHRRRRRGRRHPASSAPYDAARHRRPVDASRPPCGSPAASSTTSPPTAPGSRSTPRTRCWSTRCGCPKRLSTLARPSPPPPVTRGRTRRPRPNPGRDLMAEFEYPTQLRYTAEHEWVGAVRRRPAVVRVGITAYAQDALGDIVFVQLPEPGRGRRGGAVLRRGGVDQERQRGVRAGRGHRDRAQRGARRQPRAGQLRPLRRGLDVRDPARRPVRGRGPARRRGLPPTRSAEPPAPRPGRANPWPQADVEG